MIRRPATRRRLLAATALAYLSQSVIGAQAATVFVNEFHYDNTGGDTGEFFEIAGEADTSLDGWKLVLYNGNNNAAYGTIDLFGTLTDQANGYGFATFDYSGIQNGSPDGFALVDDAGSVVEFLSYEGSFTASGGAADGLTSTDIGVSEPGSTPVGYSLQRTGTGFEGSDFEWTAPQPNTAGSINAGQSFGQPQAPTEPPAPQTLAIYEIQGAGHVSAYEGQAVETTGIVTGLASNGYYVQDAEGDGDIATSDGVFVFTGGSPAVAVGDAVSISGEVTEYRPSSQAEALTLTEITSATTQVLSSGNALPEAVIMGLDGRTAPTETIDDDGLTSFDPRTDGIDYYESLEGMLVRLPGAQAVSTANRFGEVYAVGNSGAYATGMNEAGGITISEGDFNPERIQIQPGNGTDVASPNVGDGLGDVTGHLGYSFSDYEIVTATDVAVTEAANNTPEVTTLVSGPRALTVATYNIQQATASDSDRIEALAQQIVGNLKNPDVIGLQEVLKSSSASPEETLQALADAIVEAGGPRYDYTVLDPQDGGTILPAFLYTGDVALESSQLLPGAENDPAFDRTRTPLVATFTFGGEEFTIINNHLTSRIGSSPAFGATQPPIDGGEDRRVAQAEAINAFVDSFLASDPDASVIALGDFNAFQFSPALQALVGEDGVLTNAIELIAEMTDAYTYNFEGNSQALDHILLSAQLLEAYGVSLDFVHLNTLFADAVSDHDPILLQIALGDAIPLPAAFWMMLAGLASVFGLRRRGSAHA